MASTLTYGYVKPATGDKGSTFWAQLEADIQQLNDHAHNGSNSAKLTAASAVATVQSISSASWVDQGDGVYRQLVTLPAALTNVSGTYDDYAITMRNAANGRPLLLSLEKVSTTTYYVYINDNTLDLKALYT